MQDIMNHSATEREAIKLYLTNNSDWVKNISGVSDIKELSIISNQDWTDDIVSIAYKRKYFNDSPGIVNHIKDDLSISIGKKIVSVYTTDDSLNNNFTFNNNGKRGEWRVSSSHHLLAVKIDGLSTPIIIVKEHVALSCYPDKLWFMLYPLNCLDEFASFIQAEEANSKRIRLDVVGQGIRTVKPINWDQIVLDESVEFLIKKDLDYFINKESWYKDKGIPFRRGYLLHGPPGNGKTTAIRAILTQLGLPAYTINRMHENDSLYYFDEMFQSAAAANGAVIILEDIDRSFSEKGDGTESKTNAIPFSVLLNSLDGVSESDGIIVIATANVPQVLDRAILERPGRFDRVVSFPNPDFTLRKKYLRSFIPEMQDSDLNSISTTLDGMSFAQIREVYILAVQTAVERNSEINTSDLSSAHERFNYYMKKAGGKPSTGFKLAEKIQAPIGSSQVVLR